MPYVDGYVVPVPEKTCRPMRDRSDGRKSLARSRRSRGSGVRRDDVKPGKLTSFPLSVKLKAGETVMFSWIVFKSRAHRDWVNAKVMKDPRLADSMDPKSCAVQC
jgi:uncharacterized protein YbaA (DUF1428 family)